MTPLSCNCLSRPAPSLVILCSEPTRRSPGIVSCSGSHQPVQTLTPPPRPLSPHAHTNPTPFTPRLVSSVAAGAVGVRHWLCHWQSRLVSAASELRRWRALPSSSTAILTVGYISSPLRQKPAQKKKTLDPTSYSVTPHFIATLRWFYGR